MLQLEHVRSILAAQKQAAGGGRGDGSSNASEDAAAQPVKKKSHKKQIKPAVANEASSHSSSNRANSSSSRARHSGPAAGKAKASHVASESSSNERKSSRKAAHAHAHAQSATAATDTTASNSVDHSAVSTPLMGSTHSLSHSHTQMAEDSDSRMHSLPVSPLLFNSSFGISPLTGGEDSTSACGRHLTSAPVTAAHSHNSSRDMSALFSSPGQQFHSTRDQQAADASTACSLSGLSPPVGLLEGRRSSSSSGLLTSRRSHHASKDSFGATAMAAGLPPMHEGVIFRPELL